jgi:hypothetical protein
VESNAIGEHGEGWRDGQFLMAKAQGMAGAGR